jgi:hypothetical protein
LLAVDIGGAQVAKLCASHLQSLYQCERIVELTVPARNCIFERPVDLDIRLDALSFDTKPFQL